MLFWTIIKSAFGSLYANKLRSFLAMLGIIIGVGAVIAMLAMGAGAQAQINARFQSMGTNLLYVRPAQAASGGANIGQAKLYLDDALAIAQVPGVAAASPYVNGQVQARYEDRNNRMQVNGVAEPYFEIHNIEIEKGRAFTDAEGERLARVCVLGPTAAQNLFGQDDPIGESVKFSNVSFTVIGVSKTKGDQGFFNPDEAALIPYTTAMSILYGQKKEELKQIDVQVADVNQMNEVSGQPPGTGGFGGRWGRGGTVHTTPPPPDSITALLRARHKLKELSEPDDFTIQNQAELLANFSDNITTFRLLLGGIATISLVVGGIGIMNIMLVTVTERTREIGTRKAIGAKNRDVLLQFLVEAVVMSGLGGALGALAGVGLAQLLPHLPRLSAFPPPVIESWVVVMAVLVSGGVGVFFGLYPAYRASLLDPIEALRYE